MIRSVLLTLIVLLFSNVLLGQRREFTMQDTLRGSITEERKWWDLAYYHLDISVDPSDSTIEGSNTVGYRVLEPGQVMQIDLQPPLTLRKAEQAGNELKITDDGNAHYIHLLSDQKVGQYYEVKLWYGGHPHVALRPPWSGGIQWEHDQNGNPFIATSCQGIGASIWWPCKDHMYDEPDSMLISVNVPAGLTDVSNGRLRKVEEHDNQTKTYHWFVSNPINNYGVNINIADYAHFSEVFQGEKGALDCDYYVLRDNLDKAKEQFKQAPMMLEAFEYWFGPYPFYEDGYKLVEVPYPGMEHQSSITYGNGYENGFGGRDGSRSGWGMKFDFIIIHESGHEWFANSITYKDVADMWIHESFINYSENLYVEYHYGIEAGREYVLGTRMGIRNDRPIIGTYDVNSGGSGDMYPKGGNMLHTLRQLIQDDGKWRSILRGLNEEFYHQTVTTEQIEQYIIDHSGLDLSGFFDQYLRDQRLPVLEYSIKANEIYYRYSNCIRGFDLPLKVTVSGEEQWINPTTRWATLEVESAEATFAVDPNFYIAVLNITGR
ncbi:MAG: M1 family metallopeptidase [Bacteroidales bacterium]|nr:M1 family metallopeptidase [Bacteroidales bacterium]